MIKKIQSRHWPAILLVAVILILAVVVVLNFQARTPAPEQTDEEVAADLTLGQFEYTETRKGQKQWTIVADSAGYHKDQGRTRIVNPRVTFFDEEGESGNIFLSARHGEINTETRELEVWEDVQVESASGYKLTGERLFYDDARRLVTSQDPVRIFFDGFDVAGRGLRLKVDSRVLEIPQEVEAHIDGRLMGRQAE